MDFACYRHHICAFTDRKSDQRLWGLFNLYGMSPVGVTRVAVAQGRDVDVGDPHRIANGRRTNP